FRLFVEIERAVFAEYGWPGAEPVLERVALTDAERARYVGRFTVSGGVFAIVERGGALQLERPFAETAQLVPIGKDRVVDRDGGTITLAPGGELVLGQFRGPQKVPVKRLADGARHPLLELAAGRFDDAVALWREQAKADPEAARGDEDHVNLLGYR